MPRTIISISCSNEAVAGHEREPELVTAVRQAFVDGLHTASFVAAGATLPGAVVVGFALPARGRTDKAPRPQAEADGALAAG